MLAASAALFHANRRPSQSRRAHPAQPNKNGRSAPSAGFVISAKPHNNPYTHQSRNRSDSASSSVAHKTVAAKSADREVSQIHSNGIKTPFGKSAHSHAPPLATPSPLMRFPE